MELPSTQEELIRDLGKVLSPDQVSGRPSDLLSYGRDCNAKATLWMRQNQLKYPPEAVVWPESAEQVSRVLRFAGERGLPVVPFGGGSGVCGGTWALKGGISLDLKRMDQVLKVDALQMQVRAQTGINGELFERELQRVGLTLGHFPSSIYVATLGGYLACRSAGQFSTQYGKIEDMVTGLQVVLADGEILQLQDVAQSPGTLDGKELFLGSEGTLGVITEATLKVHPQPEIDRYLAFHFENLESGLQAVREIMQNEIRPCVVRLYDELDTYLATSYSDEDREGIFNSLGKIFSPLLHLAKDNSLKLGLKKPRWLNRALEMLPKQCLLILGFQGLKSFVEAQASWARRICAPHRAADLGEKPGRYWLKHRYSVSYKLSPYFDEGFFADTMEVATTWSNLLNLYHAIRSAMADHAAVMAHFSHAYPEGCSIYFTFLAHQAEKQSERLYDLIWEEALQACVTAGGTISHHHGIGVLKAAYMPREWGEAFEWLRGVKRRLDPKNILNPGKLGFDS